MAPIKFCPRNLKPGGPNSKRYMATGPLVAYVLACPSCGFIEMHQHSDAQFEEQDGVLVAARKPLRCMSCRRVISIAGGIVLAYSDDLPARSEGGR